MTRDVLQLKYRLRSDVDENLVKFDLVITEWTSSKVVLWMNFTDPALVSHGKLFDQAYVSIINPNLFVSKSTGVVLQDGFHILSDNFPR